MIRILNSEHKREWYKTVEFIISWYPAKSLFLQATLKPCKSIAI